MNKNYGQELAAQVKIGPVELIPMPEVPEIPAEPESDTPNAQVVSLTDFATSTTKSRHIKEAAWLLADFLRENPDGTLDDNWKQQGECGTKDSATFYPERKSSVPVEAKEICGRCAVRAQCLVFALRTKEPHGVWGGLSSAQRTQLRKSIGDSLPSIFDGQTSA